MDLAKKLTFADPPEKPKPVRVSGFEQFTAQLMAHPNQWAIIGANARAYQVAALKKDFPDFEFTYRSPATGKVSSTSAPDKTVYARYRGTDWMIERARKAREGGTVAAPATKPADAERLAG